jgi:hypothetical protein
MKWTASTMGKKGGASASPAKAEASRRNGRKGGRPVTTQIEIIKEEGDVDLAGMSAIEAYEHFFGKIK